MTYRVLVTGSRDWDDPGLIFWVLDTIAQRIGGAEHMTVVHGCARGADSYAARWAREAGATEERHPADWGSGRSAGHRRNAEMVAAGAAECVAFIKDESRGATGCAGLAEQAGIPVQRYTPRVWA